MKKCYLCDISLTAENRSKEHIFLNAIGGKLKSKEIICRDCNKKFGEKIDFALSEQLKPFATLFNIKRDDREIAKPFDAIGVTSGKNFRIEAGGKPAIKNPSCEEKKTSESKVFYIETKDKDKARQILNGLKKKYPSIDMERALDSFVHKDEYLTENLSFSTSLGGEDAFRSLCKTAVNFYMHKNGDILNIKHLIPYIKGESDNGCVFFYYPEHEIIERQQSEVLHSIIILGNETEKILYAYIELFNFYRIIVLLNDNYGGGNFNHSYFYNILKCDEIQRCFNLCMEKEMILEILKGRILPLYEIRKEIEKIRKIWKDKASKEHFGRLIDNALPEGIIAPEMFDEFFKKFMKEIMPWIIANFNDVDSI